MPRPVSPCHLVPLTCFESAPAFNSRLQTVIFVCRQALEDLIVQEEQREQEQELHFHQELHFLGTRLFPQSNLPLSAHFYWQDVQAKAAMASDVAHAVQRLSELMNRLW